MRPPWPIHSPGLRALGFFWAGVLVIAVVGGAVLQTLGPPPRAHAVVAPETTSVPLAVAAASPEPAPHAAPVKAVASLAGRPGRSTPGPIAAPDPALLQPVEDDPGAFLPRIAADGRTPSQVYARGFDPTDTRPRIAVLLAGVGLNGSESEDAVRTLPGAITLAFSPYTSGLSQLLEATRAAGHEFLISLPMEPQGYPLNDAGDHALLTALAPQMNRSRLDWALSRISGYVGATGALGLLHGERFAGSPQMLPVLDSLADRGLLYVDARPGRQPLPKVWSHGVDMVIDEPAVRTEIEAKLAALEQIARDKGSALGLAGATRPVTVDRIAAWANGLAAKGLALAPVSAIVVVPRAKEPDANARDLTAKDAGR
jgi:polysaccharide deacetylase 2 family uncharacterized protein YibQ